jgi:hypothetical protein
MLVTKAACTSSGSQNGFPEHPSHRVRRIIHNLYVVSNSSVILATANSAIPHELLLKRVDDLNSIDFPISLHIF